ncbi:hypothetical protein ACIBF1_38975 [Spirillospora sp. NPDC050679]
MWAAPHAPHPSPRSGPSAGWYSVPAILVAAAVIWTVLFVAGNAEGLSAAGGPSAEGDAESGVTVRLAEGYGYFLYVDRDAPAPTSCSVTAAGAYGQVALTRKNSWSASTEAGHRYTATFQAPLSGRARLTCQGTQGRILVKPDDTVAGYLGLTIIGGGGALVLAGVVWAVVFVRRNNARRRAAAPPGAPGGYPPGPYPYG